MTRVRVLNSGDIVDVVDVTDNAFCPTGKGGGVDPTCGKGGKGRGVSEKRKQVQKKAISRIEEKINRQKDALESGSRIGVDLSTPRSSLEITGIVSKREGMYYGEIRTSSGFGNLGPKEGTVRGNVSSKSLSELSSKLYDAAQKASGPTSRD